MQYRTGLIDGCHFWAKTHPFTSSGAGWAYADVITGVVTLANGTICYAHGPEASAYL